LGHALQLTNILRDVRNDAERGRIYIPLGELERHEVTPDEVLGLVYSERFALAAASVAARARNFYNMAARTLPATDRRSMIAAELMGAVYWRLLRKLEKRRFDVFGPHPARLSRADKIVLTIWTWMRLRAGATSPNYGVG
jgi:phytoene synthase